MSVWTVGESNNRGAAMRSCRLESPGRLDGIVPGEEPVPTPAGILVHAVSLDRRDALILHERHPCRLNGRPFGKVVIRTD